MPRPRVRADQLLVDRGLAESRARAQALILAGLVYAGERKVAKAGEAVAEGVALEVRGRDHPWVSRGGLKLDHALAHFGWDVAGAVALDVGASTGGFTDVLLTRGAARVYAIDSGTNQLAWKLRSDDRVISHERTNARLLTATDVPEPVDVIVCDASFIALAKVLARPLEFAAPAARLVALVKPQFEAGRGEVGKGGVVRDPAVHARVCADAAAWVEGQGWAVAGIVPSPITGPEGNVEFLLAARRRAGGEGEIASTSSTSPDEEDRAGARTASTSSTSPPPRPAPPPLTPACAGMTKGAIGFTWPMSAALPVTGRGQGFRLPPGMAGRGGRPAVAARHRRSHLRS